MTNHSVYRVATDYVTYLVFAPSEEAALRCLWETEGTPEEEWRSNNDNLYVGIVSPNKWDTIFMHDGPLKSVSAVVAETKLGPDEAEVLCCSEY